MTARILPKYFWGEAVATSVYIINISPTKAMQNATPYEAWKGRKPMVSHLRIIGYIIYTLIDSQLRKKQDDKSEKCIFVVYSPQPKCKAQLNKNINVVIFPRVEWYFVEKIWDFLEAIMTFTKT